MAALVTLPPRKLAGSGPSPLPCNIKEARASESRCSLGGSGVRGIDKMTEPQHLALQFCRCSPFMGFPFVTVPTGLAGTHGACCGHRVSARTS